MKIDEDSVVARFDGGLRRRRSADEPAAWVAPGRPLEVDEATANDEPSMGDIEEARQNYLLRMSPELRAYVAALRRRFDGFEDETRLLN
jgi:hypothetical protein